MREQEPAVASDARPEEVFHRCHVLIHGRRAVLLAPAAAAGSAKGKQAGAGFWRCVLPAQASVDVQPGAGPYCTCVLPAQPVECRQILLAS